jgi:D-glycero-D-manno-heptose 1,7-bisphosphate phosphatase
VVGDSARDVLAGVAAGCEPHLVLTGKGAAYRGRSLPDTFPKETRVHADLAAFADFLIAREVAKA